MVKSGSFQGNSISKLGAQDIRFTRNKANTVIYAIALGWPVGRVCHPVAGNRRTPRKPGKIEHVQLLGTDEKLKWKQTSDGLRVELPRHFQPASDFAAALKISLA